MMQMISGLSSSGQRLIAACFLLFATSGSLAQGTVNFFNDAATLVSVGALGQQTPISEPPNSYYFGLLIAPAGTTNPSQFSFSTVYATNRGAAFPGQLFGGVGVAVPGWPKGVLMTFSVAGWSSSLGHNWNQGWLMGDFGASGYFGLSSFATATPGGSGGGVPQGNLDLFGPVTIASGWSLAPVLAIPEPSAAAIIATGAMALMLKHHRKKS
jgi:hypothetical protein